jgi:general secretion pathway protein J
MAGRRSSAGFTLVELLVALFAMALLAVLSWRGLDGMTRAQEQTQTRSDDVLALQVGLQQWAADLDAMIEWPRPATLDWNGRVLRIIRSSGTAPGDGVIVAAWTRRISDTGGTWMRWQSAPALTREQLDQAWQDADLWSQNQGDARRQGEVAITPLADWQVFYFRGNAWTNPQSSADSSVAPAKQGASGAGPATPIANQLPDGVRLVLTLPAGQPITGTLTRDWVRPTFTRARQ